MATPDSSFHSPEQRHSTAYFRHIAGFEVLDTGRSTTFVTLPEIESDGDLNFVAVRKTLKMDYDEISPLSEEYILRQMILPLLPLGFYGDEAGEPVILNAQVTVEKPEDDTDNLYYSKKGNHLQTVIAPTLGRLCRVTYERRPRLGAYGVDLFSITSDSLSVSLSGGLVHAVIHLNPLTPLRADPFDNLLE